ncbi:MULTISPECIES: CTP synthase [Thermodesulfovibrio]|jgi:CTP synthase|uniref:CTP synthase n=1 Tax=Thermodesulfovibrio TaxID=28261 RepID=UPI0026232C47|nr:CTP synthase [Thermodesulfovibrio sp.]
MPKYIFITGGVVSALGKGIAAAAIGALLEAKGFKVTIQKLDPYINVDPGTLSPFEHGEVYVTDDGCETDLDLGHYERFTHLTTSHVNNYTSGKIYFNVISKERRGDYLGHTVQVVPHVTDEIKEAIKSAAGDNEYEIVIVEVGGTVGDIEGLPFLEGIRQLRYDVGRENVCYIHLTLVPYIKSAGELKTKPTQHSVNSLRAIGIQPDILLCRADRPIPHSLKKKIALHCNLDFDAVISAHDVDTVYEVPLNFKNEGLDLLIEKRLSLPHRIEDLSPWENVVDKIKNPKTEVNIAVVGKYVGLKDSYKSLTEALIHGGIANNARVNIIWISSEDIEKEGAKTLLGEANGILIPGGFGVRGIEGKIEAIRYARENKIPFFGICLGMQCAVIELSRNLAKLNANSTEFDPETEHPVIYLMERWYNPRTDRYEIRSNESQKGGTMRLGAYPCTIKEGTKAFEAYKTKEISERHRHRYEFNNKYVALLEEKGAVFSGTSPDGQLVEIIELREHPWFLGCQFHPEFKSKPFKPHPLFREFIKASLNAKKTLFSF